MLSLLTHSSAVVTGQVSDSGDKQAVRAAPVKVYVMMGQSNMLGFGRVGPKETIGSLEYLVKQKGKYSHLLMDLGNWITRQDVRYVHVMDPRGVDYRDLEKFSEVRNEWLVPNKSFGPELGFGQVMGEFHDELVLLLKACIGNRSLGWDLLPPGSERFEHEGKIYAGSKDVANFWDKGTEPKPVPWYAGRQYDADTAHAKAVLKNIEKYYPGYAGQGYEVAGFVWWQGHKIKVQPGRSLRTEHGAPDQDAAEGLRLPECKICAGNWLRKPRHRGLRETDCRSPAGS
ncbi:MAG: sialate O-acetylesterase [Planctomycetaceae bacterium]